MKKLAFIGAGCQADAVLPMVDQFEYRFVGFYDDKVTSEYDGYPVLGKLNEVKNDLDNGKIDCVFIAIGDNSVRRSVYDHLGEQYQKKLINIVSKTATILTNSSILGAGTFIGNNAYLGAKAEVGANCIINTGAIVEHHCKIGDHSTVATNATLNGVVTLGEEAYIGSGATVIQTKKICSKATVGAGAVVVKEINEPGVYVGVPAERIK